MTTANKLTYRSDLDGLRAFAVLTVIFFHAGVTTFSGGFIGVDVFFVLSGFLITGIINAQVDKDRFSIPNFYMGRIRRLLPVFFLFVAVVTIFASALVIPEAYVDYLRSIKHGYSFRSNLFFAEETSGYFAANGEIMPLLHTWSLSIEWQFYLIWPILLYGLKRFLSVNVTLFILVAAFFAAVSYSNYFSQTSAGVSYYSFTARIFEMLAGAIMALWLVSSRSLNRWVAHVLSLCALAALGYFAVTYTNKTVYPGLNALWVCVATMVLIYTGSQRHVGLGNTLLSVKPFVFIGLLSYSLYLWHWPILAFSRILNIEITYGALSIILALTFLLSWFSWKFVETPFRRDRIFSNKKTFILFWLIPTLMFVALSDAAKNGDGFPSRFGDRIGHIPTLIESVEVAGMDLCDEPKPTLSVDDCLFGAVKPGKVDAVLFGDSHARHFRPFIDVMAKDAKLSVYGVHTPACMAVPKMYRKNDNRGCLDVNTRAFALIEERRPKYVIYGQNWGPYFGASRLVFNDDDELTREATQKRIIEGFINGLDIVKRSGAIPVIIQASPQDRVDLLACFYQHVIERRDADPKECIIEEDRIFTKTEKKNRKILYAAIKRDHPNTIFVDPKDIQCIDGQCFTSFDGIPMYEDDHHMNPYASKWLAEQYLERFGNPFTNNKDL